MKEKLIKEILKLNKKAVNRGIYAFGVFDIRTKDITNENLELEKVSDLKKIKEEFTTLFKKSPLTRVEMNSWYNGWGTL